MSTKDYGPREQFGLFTNDYKDAANKPDKTGSFVLSREFLKACVTLVKQGEEPKIRVSAWVNENVPGKKDNIRVFMQIANYAGSAPKPAPKQASFDDDDMPW
jgi:hypothetical protein